MIGLPDVGQVIATQQVGQHRCVDLIRLHLGLGNGFRGHGVGNNNSRHMGPEYFGHRPAVGCGFQRHVVRRAQGDLSKGLQDDIIRRTEQGFD